MHRRVFLVYLALLSASCSYLPDLPYWPGSGVSLPLESVTDRRAAFGRAYDAFRRHDDDTALPIFRTLSSAYPALADYHLYFAGVSAARLQRHREAKALLERLLDEFPNSVHVSAAELQLGRVELQRGNINGARAHLYRGANIATDKDISRAARLEIARAELANGDTSAAYRGFSEVREEAPGTAVGREAKEHLLTLRATQPELAPSGDDRLREARLLIAEGDHDAAEQLVNRLRDSPGDIDPAIIARLLADVQYALGKLEPALKSLWNTADRYPQSPEGPQALLRMATILWNRDRDAAARRVFADFLTRYPRHEKAAEAQYAIGRIDQKSGHPEAAVDAYRELAQDYPSSSLAPEARWRIGWIHYRNDRYSAAADAFAAARGSGSSATYWQARALARAGQERRARQLYTSIVTSEPDGYYALWARRRLDGTSGGLRLNAPSPESAPPLLVDPGSFDAPFHRPRAEELRAAGQLTWARRELDAIERTHGDDPAALRFLVATYPGVDGQAAAARLARRLDDSIIGTGERDRLSYPLAYWSTVRRAADPLLVDPLLVVAIMRQESLFDPQARSVADARGLLQLLPSTAERLAPSLPEVVDPGDLYDPDVNIALGVRYLHDLGNRFRGDPVKIIAAYNGGESAVDRWEQQAAGLDADELVESITYRETRDYVKKVLGNYQRYARLYGS